MTNLANLLAQDLSKISPDLLAQGVKDAETAGKEGPDWSGRLIAAMHRQAMSWSQIAAMTGLPQTTAYRRAEKYM